VNNEFAQAFAREWVNAWNSHDLNEILRHYADDFAMTSPVMTKLLNVPGGTLTGIDAVRAYWKMALELNPQLHFELLNVFTGVDSIVLNYKGHRGLSAEVFFFNSDNQVRKAVAHYQQDQSV
jgi:hypothetical protein